MNRPRAKAVLTVAAALTGSALEPSCTARLHDAVNLALEDYVLSLLDPNNLADLIDPGTDQATGD